MGIWRKDPSLANACVMIVRPIVIITKNSEHRKSQEIEVRSQHIGKSFTLNPKIKKSGIRTIKIKNARRLARLILEIGI
jgi:hypothetical protein